MIAAVDEGHIDVLALEFPDGFHAPEAAADDDDLRPCVLNGSRPLGGRVPGRTGIGWVSVFSHDPQ